MGTAFFQASLQSGAGRRLALGLGSVTVLGASVAFAGAIPAGTPAPDVRQPAMHWAEIASGHEEHVVNYDHNLPIRYRIRKIDAKGETIRELLETKDGPIQRLVELNGHLLTAAEDKDERQRLQDILNDPDVFFRHVRRDEGSHTYAIELLHSMPKAMLWTYTPGQPQLPGASHAAVVLDFTPDPHFKPPSLVTEALTSIAGRVWIDAETGYMQRVEGRILHQVDFGWGGVLARIKEGGTLELEQQPAGPHRWIYSHLSEHLTLREVLIRTVREDAEVMTTNIEVMPAPISYKEGVQQLLSLPVRTR